MTSRTSIACVLLIGVIILRSPEEWIGREPGRFREFARKEQSVVRVTEKEHEPVAAQRSIPGSIFFEEVQRPGLRIFAAAFRRIGGSFKSDTSTRRIRRRDQLTNGFHQILDIGIMALETALDL